MKEIPAVLLQYAHEFIDRDPAKPTTDSSLNDLLHQKGRLLRTKLDVLAWEITERFRIRAYNLERIGQDKERVTVLLNDVHQQSHYLLSDRAERHPFFEELFQLEVERRSQDVECWRDVVLVMRDFLLAWEAHEQAKAKAIFLEG